MKLHKGLWKSIVFVTISLCMASPAVFAQGTKTVKVFLLGGQSNMKGCGKAEDLRPPYSEPFQKITIWQLEKSKAWKEGAWVALSPTAYRTDCFGPEVAFGHAIAEAFPGEDIRLIKHAVSGKSLYDHWSPKTKGMIYTQFMDIAKAALADLGSSKVKYEIVGMLWLQGESDASKKMGETYEKNLTDFIAHMRTEFKTPDMPFVIARIVRHFGGTKQAGLVRGAQVKVAEADKNAGWFDTDDCSTINGRGGHYDSAGLIVIGKRFAETLIKLQDNEKDK